MTRREWIGTAVGAVGAYAAPSLGAVEPDAMPYRVELLDGAGCEILRGIAVVSRTISAGREVYDQIDAIRFPDPDGVRGWITIHEVRCVPTDPSWPSFSRRWDGGFSVAPGVDITVAESTLVGAIGGGS